jgi:retron-type reverse transcriptase
MENLRLADEKARRGKLHSYGVQQHDKNREANLEKLHEALLTRSFRTSDYEVFTVYEPKERLIYRLPYYPDRIVHHAIMNVLEPIWVAVFPYNTHSCIKGRGIQAAMIQTKRILEDRKNSRYCLKIDIRKFYPSIDHAVLKQIVRRKIKCPRTLWLIDEIIDSVNGSPDPLNPGQPVYGRSVPIGNYLSQYLANLVLSYVIRWVNEVKRIPGVFYADDGTMYAADKQTLQELLRELKAKLHDELRLELKGNYQVFPVAENRYDKHGRSVDFVGFRFYHKQTLIRKSIKKNFCRAAARLNRHTPLPPFPAYKQGVCSWLGWAKYSDSRNLLRTIINKDYYGKL